MTISFAHDQDSSVVHTAHVPTAYTQMTMPRVSGLFVISGSFVGASDKEQNLATSAEYSEDPLMHCVWRGETNGRWNREPSRAR